MMLLTALVAGFVGGFLGSKLQQLHLAKAENAARVAAVKADQAASRATKVADIVQGDVQSALRSLSTERDQLRRKPGASS